MDWLLASIDPSRAHEVGFAVSWHGRVMVLAWGMLAPLAVLMARFFKVMPGQDWPRDLDNQTWWRFHWMGQAIVAALTIFGVGLILGHRSAELSLHGWLGYGVLTCTAMQVLLGVFRGSKGGPTAPARDGSPRGDHYDMTPYRRMFEALHKSVGYLTLILAVVTILYGMWMANAPRWMWLSLVPWWVGLLCAFVVLQKRGFAVDTYQAIWGNDPRHPGNRGPHPGWGMRRRNLDKQDEEPDNVRDHRGDRVRGH